ncbi:hypothetical protein A2Z22_00135 [Candidatus Woesebacteria bacterium RBG_16_34_12]|uniref:Uncharacterized protein n=1 Tax=Candidatus Woesebacteria bacterium RBG_16_34_12 TaxID=1802480 RepID=A0A1F7X8V4_9BACT|nr:MAG: hypothetical protein A2Z22_00135 [Candidatus Woesebacteria bacterium RBG_16_34_12]
MNQREFHSAQLDCRGAGFSEPLTNRNDVLVTKIYFRGNLESVEVSCSRVNSKGECSLDLGKCPHLFPVDRVQPSR